MNAATAPARTPLYQQGVEYWEDLILECRRQTEAINSVVSVSESDPDNLVQWDGGPGVHMIRTRQPSTDVKVELNLQSWGPTIHGIITGHQTQELKFASEEFEFNVTSDLDGAAVAVFEEGRSFSPVELAAYITQKFQRCFPSLSLPCRTWERAAPEPRSLSRV